MSQTNKPKKHIKGVALLVSVLLLVCVTVGGTLAYIITASGPITNLFNPSKVTTEVYEEIGQNIKQNVKIQNTGDTEAWIRVAVIVTWQNEDGNVYGRKPVEGSDYSLDLNVYNESEPIGNSKWIKGADNFYYWPLPVKSDEEAPLDCSTGILINSCSYINNAPEGYFLSVEILGSGIQSKPDRVFNDEWGSSGLEVKNVNDVRQLVKIGG